MPRHARLKIAGLPLHIIQRGNNRGNCFFEGRDYVLYLGLLEELGNLFSCALHAYVLMTNHVHLLLTPQNIDGASSLMKHLGQRYVQHVNRTYGRTGTLWEGRFRSSLVDSETYLMRCYRYIELNPVRAEMVTHPGNYPWSSYAANAEGKQCALVKPHGNFLALGDGSEERLERYRALVDEPLTLSQLQEIRDAANGGFALGSPSFVDNLQRQLNKRAVRGCPGRPNKNRGQTTFSR
jgi:putative transposase